MDHYLKCVFLKTVYYIKNNFIFLYFSFYTKVQGMIAYINAYCLDGLSG